MSGVNKLSDCKDVCQFNAYMQDVKPDKNGRFRNTKNKRTYTMNQIIYQFDKCKKESEKKYHKKTTTDINSSIKLIDNLKDNQSISSSLRKRMGNAWFSFTHGGFSKKETLEKSRKEYSKAAPSNDLPQVNLKKKAAPVNKQAISPLEPQNRNPINKSVDWAVIKSRNVVIDDQFPKEKFKRDCTKGFNQAAFDAFEKSVSHLRPEEQKKAMRGRPPHMKNKLMLENTCFKANDNASFKYHEISSRGLDALWNRPVTAKKINLTMVDEEFYRYDQEGHNYVNFANATRFGGGVLTTGSVQEERMFWEFPALFKLNFLARKNVHPCVDQDGVSHKNLPPLAKARPYIIEGVQRQFDISKVRYGRDMWDMSDDEVKAGIKPLDGMPKVDLMGLASIDFDKIPSDQRKYTKEDLEYLLSAAFLGFQGAQGVAEARGDKTAAVVHTGLWGCGVFKNSVYMTVAIQSMAAKMAGVDLVYHGVHNGQKFFNEPHIRTIDATLDEMIQKGFTPAAMLEDFLRWQEEDTVWAPVKN